MLSKMGICSRTTGAAWAREGRVTVNGVVRRDPEFPIEPGRDQIRLDGSPVASAGPVYLMLNKPRGLVTTARDEKGRPTIHECLRDAPGAHLIAVGRLDQASEGLLLITNDTAWAAGISDPRSGMEKIYHVQIDRLPEEDLTARLVAGVITDGGRLAAARAAVLRTGQRGGWLEIALTEGRNRHIRRMLEALGIGVRRLVRVAIGGLVLGGLAKGSWRHLTQEEMENLKAPLPPAKQRTSPSAPGRHRGPAHRRGPTDRSAGSTRPPPQSPGARRD
jgi:23S rRNA pseudouridine2605 synthase